MQNVLRDLPKSGRRLGNGLALRMRCRRGLWVLTVSRINDVLRRRELAEIGEAICGCFRPSIVFRDEHAEPRLIDGRRHYIQRFYWPADGRKVTIIRPRGRENGKRGA